MDGEIEYKEDVVYNTLGILNDICTDLQNAENNLNGIDAEANSLEIANLNTSQVQKNINKSKEKINNIINNIKSLDEEFDVAERNNTEIIDLLRISFTKDAISKEEIAEYFAEYGKQREGNGNSLKFSSDIEYTRETYSGEKIKEILEGAGITIDNPIVREFTVWVPSTMDKDNKTEYAIMFYNGGYRDGSEPQKISTIIKESGLENPDAIIIEFKSRPGTSSNPWLVYKTTVAQETKAILDYVYNQKGLSKESTTGIAVRI